MSQIQTVVASKLTAYPLGRIGLWLALVTHAPVGGTGRVCIQTTGAHTNTDRSRDSGTERERERERERQRERERERERAENYMLHVYI
jgi:hypothetical protein